MGKRTSSNVREDTVDNLLDRLSVMREEILAIERSLERIQAAKVEHGKDGSGKDGLWAKHWLSRQAPWFFGRNPNLLLSQHDSVLSDRVHPAIVLSQFPRCKLKP
jgi:hypothetical protein